LIEKIEDHQKSIKYDGSLPMALGKSRHEKNWKNKTLPWSQIINRLENPTRTAEAYVDFISMPKAKQDVIKDVGGFIGGHLKNGRRKAENILMRQMVALDADFAPTTLIEDLEIQVGYNYVLYSTHKHSNKKPRLRMLIPLDREVSPDEYEAIARKIADDIGIDYFDDTTYQASRLMYWGSVAKDGDYVFEYYDQPWLSADKVLSEYPDWTDISYWPESSRTKEKRKKTAVKQGDPCEKRGLIGAFCRTYSIEDAITIFLSDVYEPCAMSERYTYLAGSTAAGLVLYDDKFAYSNHATDPAGGILCNSFDLVRLHKYGQMDEDVAPDTVITSLPSYKEMVQFVRGDGKTKSRITKEKQEAATADFDEADLDWTAKLDVNKQGDIENSLNNLALIMKNDDNLQGIAYNKMTEGIEILKKAPWVRERLTSSWTDADDSHLEMYLAKVYTEFPKNKVLTALIKSADDRAYHPVVEYLENLPVWDRVKRVDTLLIDYLGAEDNLYIQAVARKTLCAAIARATKPGCKFDTMLVLNGPQGVGKSTLLAKLAGEWFSDSMSLSDTKDKTAAEKIQGHWINEIGELAGIRKTDIETLKGFLSRQDDKYRASYGRVVTSHPRQGIFVGTTNAEEGYLRDITGGRRFWPVKVTKGAKRPWDLDSDEVKQIWAEALNYAKEGETLYLDDELDAIANEERREAMESDSKEGIVQGYLERLLPEDWYQKDIYERREFLYGGEFGSTSQEGTMKRETVSNMEVWCECFKKDAGNFENRKAFEIRGILEKLGWKTNGKRAYVNPYGRLRIYENHGTK